MTTGTPRKPPVFGPEPWSELAGRSWSYWDLWFAAVAVADCAGSLDDLEAHLVGELRSHVDGRQGAESKLSHLADLRSRIEEAGLTPADLATSDGALRQTGAGQGEEEGERPLGGGTGHDARHGRDASGASRAALPVRPLERLPGRSRPLLQVLPPPCRGEGPHLQVQELRCRRPDRRAVAQPRPPSLSAAQRLALYRAFHTAGLELADRTDDSHGNVGQLRVGAWHTYLGIDWRAAGIRAEDYWADVCDLVVFEPYALDHQEETLPWRRVPAGQAELIEGYLLSLAAECRTNYLDYQAEEALQQLAWLAVAGRRFTPVRGCRDPARQRTLDAHRGHGRIRAAVGTPGAGARGVPGSGSPRLPSGALAPTLPALTGVDIGDDENTSRSRSFASSGSGGRS